KGQDLHATLHLIAGQRKRRQSRAWEEKHSVRLFRPSSQIVPRRVQLSREESGWTVRAPGRQLDFGDLRLPLLVSRTRNCLSLVTSSGRQARWRRAETAILAAGRSRVSS